MSLLNCMLGLRILVVYANMLRISAHLQHGEQFDSENMAFMQVIRTCKLTPSYINNAWFWLISFLFLFYLIGLAHTRNKDGPKQKKKKKADDTDNKDAPEIPSMTEFPRPLKSARRNTSGESSRTVLPDAKAVEQRSKREKGKVSVAWLCSTSKLLLTATRHLKEMASGVPSPMKATICRYVTSTYFHWISDRGLFPRIGSGSD